jgi:hypothetical protein
MVPDETVNGNTGSGSLRTTKLPENNLPYPGRSRNRFSRWISSPYFASEMQYIRYRIYPMRIAFTVRQVAG